jgi:hypothetical protein
MKPGKATIETLTDNILNFETSRRADRARSFRIDTLSKLKGVITSVAGGALPDIATAAWVDLESLSVAHRELRRAARRLAKLALKQAEQLRKEHAESDALITRIIKLEAEIDRTSVNEWDDRPIPEDAEIHAAFPTRSERHDLYAEAMRLVGAKRSKGELVKLVNWLLHKAEKPKQPTTDDIEWARAYLWRLLGMKPATHDVGELARKIAASRAA